jgi:hypothetical protein
VVQLPALLVVGARGQAPVRRRLGRRIPRQARRRGRLLAMVVVVVYTQRQSLVRLAPSGPVEPQGKRVRVSPLVEWCSHDTSTPWRSSMAAAVSWGACTAIMMRAQTSPCAEVDGGWWRGLWLHGTGSPPHLIANAARHSAGAGRVRCDYCESSRQSRIDCDSRLSTIPYQMLLRLLLCAIFGSHDVMGGPDQVLLWFAMTTAGTLRLRLRLLFCQTSPHHHGGGILRALYIPLGGHSRGHHGVSVCAIL